MKNRYIVRGMSCAACSARVEGAVSHLDGVENCSVNLLTGEMLVEGEVSPESVIYAVTRAGYGASLRGKSSEKIDTGRDVDELADNESAKILTHFIASLVPMLALMYLTMGHMLGLPMSEALHAYPLLVGLIQLILSSIVILINQRFYISGARAALHLAPNMDTLVSLGSFASYAYSIYKLFVMAIEPEAHHLHDLYFEAAAMILVLISLGKFLEAKAKGKTTSAIKSLLMLTPKEAVLLVDGEERVVKIDEVKVGDIFVVRAGEGIPTDGVVISGEGSVDEAAISGESIPVDKAVGAEVVGATIMKSGYIICRATRVGDGTTLAGIVRMVKDASSTKAPIAKLADRVSGVFVPTVLGIALLTFAGWLIASETVGFALARAVSVLVISCPCALGLATPVAIMVGSGVGARRGILYKNATSLETSGRIKTVVLDKTGTITRGEMSVTDVIPFGVSEYELLTVAYSIEHLSEHPLARAVCAYAEGLGVKRQDVSGFETLSGRGVSSKIGESLIHGVSFEYASSIADTEGIKEKYASLASLGKTPLIFIRDSLVIGIIALMDTPRDEAKEAISDLAHSGIKVVMLTGDNELVARAVADKVGISEVVAGVLPEGKEGVVARLMSERRGAVAMVGDGINDAPALTRADLGIAIGCGTDIAVDSADVVLMHSSLTDVVSVLGIGRATLWNIRENLVWAFLYNCIGIPMAIGIFGLTLNPMFGAFAMSISSFTVVMNALRLNLWRPKVKIKEKNDTPISDTPINKEEKMEVVMKVDGMMCPHCEARVKKALLAVGGVADAVPSHKDGTVTITLDTDVLPEALSEAVAAQGYDVLGIE